MRWEVFGVCQRGDAQGSEFVVELFYTFKPSVYPRVCSCQYYEIFVPRYLVQLFNIRFNCNLPLVLEIETGIIFCPLLIAN